MRFTCRNVESGRWQSIPCIVVQCYKNLLREEMSELAAEGGLSIIDKLKGELQKQSRGSDNDTLPNPPVTIRVVNEGLQFSAQHLNTKRYSTGVLLVELFVLDVTNSLDNLVGKEVEIL